MELKILDTRFDKVIKSTYLTLRADYDFALNNFVPLINKLHFQRNPLRASFYERLEKDILDGCIMPPLTIALNMDDDKIPDIVNLDENFIISQINRAFILDGIQRLNTLMRICQDVRFDRNGVIYINFLICNSMDHLLYRMITLNNGQKPMTTRHQIEILADNIFDFDNLPLLAISEKEAKTKKAKKQEEGMSKEVLIKGYLAYISNSINIDNQKIIESKMDELIAEQIMESKFIERESQYSDVIAYIHSYLNNDKVKEWFTVANNFIGFSAAMATNFDNIKYETSEQLESAIILFEEAFSAIDVSKIKLGLSRRRMTKYYFEKYECLTKLSVNHLIDHISQEL